MYGPPGSRPGFPPQQQQFGAPPPPPGAPSQFSQQPPPATYGGPPPPATYSAPPGVGGMMPPPQTMGAPPQQFGAGPPGMMPGGVAPPQATPQFGAPPPAQQQATPQFGAPPPGVAGMPPMTGAPPTMMGGPPPMTTGAPPTMMGGPPPMAGNGPPPMGGMAPPTAAGMAEAQAPPPSANKAMFFAVNQDGSAGVETTRTGPPASGGVPGMMGGPPTAGMGMTGPPGAPAPPPDPMSQYQAQAAVPGSFGGAPGVGPGGQMGAPPGQVELPQLAEVDMEAQCFERFMKFSVNAIPNSSQNAAKSHMPLGVVIQPMALDENGDDEIDVVNFGTSGIIRCKRCRTYINPFVSWMDNGRRWRCNLCGLPNDVPSSYFCHLDSDGMRRDKDQRPELNCGSVEFIAPGEYMVRPPQAPVYFFVIDVSAGAVQSGMLATVIGSIKSALDELPGDPRTQIGFCSFDSTVHFYNLKSTLNQPQMIVVPDSADLFLPLPDDLLVNLSESRDVINALLDSMPTMFKDQRQTETALGPALVAAFRAMGHIGGKMCVFQSNLPAVGEGRLRHRENPRLYGSAEEHTMLNNEDQWYKTKAIEFSRLQISVDLFVGAPNGQYQDVATMSALPKYTGGKLFHYPAFQAARDGAKLHAELRRTLLQPTGFESVMRVRCTRGMRISNFYGNYFIRGTDLLALPNCNSDSTFAVELVHDDALLTASMISVQAALLYTTSSGERRIRVHTICVPVTSVLNDLFDKCDIDVTCNLMAKQAVATVQKQGFAAARDRVQQQCVEMLRTCRTASGGGGGYSGYGLQGMQQQQQQAQAWTPPETMQLLPLYTMALQKNAAFRGGSEVSMDTRVGVLNTLNNMPVSQTRVFIYPRFFSLHDMPNEVGRPAGDGDADVATAGRNKIRLPVVLGLSQEKLASNGVFMLEDSTKIWIWVGRDADPAFLSAVFGVKTLEGVDCSQIVLQDIGSDLSTRINAIINAVREDRPARYMQVHVVREGDPNVTFFHWHLVEDRAAFQGGSFSYAEFMSRINQMSMSMGGGM